MSRYIDADKIEYEEHGKIGLGIDYGINESDTYYTTTKERIDSIPTADVVEVKHGKWLYDDGCIAGGKYPGENVHCSICGQSAPGKPWWECNLELTDFCPNCGADMRYRRGRNDAEVH